MAKSDDQMYVGVDVGGTKILACLSDASGTLIASVKTATPHPAGAGPHSLFVARLSGATRGILAAGPAEPAGQQRQVRQSHRSPRQ